MNTLRALLFRTGSKKFQSTVAISTLVIGLIGLAFFAASPGIQSAYALSFPASPPVVVNGAGSSNILKAGFYGGSCTYLNYFYSYWIDNTAKALYVSSSTDGQTWGVATNLLTLTGLGVSNDEVQAKISCTGQTIVVVWTNATLGLGPSSVATLFMRYDTGAMGGGTVLMNTMVQGPISSSSNCGGGGCNIHFNHNQALQFGCVNYVNGIVTYCVTDQFSAGVPQYAIVSNNVQVANSTTFNGGGAENSMMLQFNNQGTYMIYWDVPASGQACRYALSTNLITWGSVQTISSTYCAAVTYSAVSTITTYNGNFILATVPAGGVGSYIVTIGPSGLLVGTPVQWATSGAYYNSMLGVSSDSNGNFVVFGYDSGTPSMFFASSTNGALSFTSPTAFSLGGLIGNNLTSSTEALEPSFSTTLEALAIESANAANPYKIYEVLIGIPQSSGSSQTQTVGSCPSKNTNTFPMVNSTIYMYYTNALGNEIVNTITTSVSSVGGSTGTHTLQFLIYASTSNTANVNTPLNLVYSRSIAISSGATHQIITVQPNLALPSSGFLSNGALWGIGIVGDNKININQSSLSGIFTQAGNPSTQSQPASFNSQGTSVGTMLYLCGVALFQSVLTVTSTVTSGAGTGTTTVTTTISTIGPGFFSTASNWPIVFLVLLLPAGLFLAVTRNMAGGIVGLMIGAVIGVLLGVLPAWVFIGLVIACIAIAFVARSREN